LWKKHSSENLFEKFWFSLNKSLSCLIYWHDKYEQDVGKFPLGKFELTKCCQLIYENANNLTSSTASVSDFQGLEFKISFHQGTSTAHFKAASMEKKIMWCEALKLTCEQIANICVKCKPKLIVNPMVSNSNSSANLECCGNDILSSPYQSVRYSQTEQEKVIYFFFKLEDKFNI